MATRRKRCWVPKQVAEELGRRGLSCRERAGTIHVINAKGTLLLVFSPKGLTWLRPTGESGQARSAAELAELAAGQRAGPP